MISTILIIAAVFIIIVIGFRLVTHFYFCNRISEKNPGQKIKGCPIWTQKGYKNPKDRSKNNS